MGGEGQDKPAGSILAGDCCRGAMACLPVCRLLLADGSEGRRDPGARISGGRVPAEGRCAGGRTVFVVYAAVDGKADVVRPEKVCRSALCGKRTAAGKMWRVIQG